MFRKNLFKKAVSLSMVSAMTVGMLAGCGSDKDSDTSKTPLVVGYSTFSQKFSPFFNDTSYDLDVVAMTQVELMTTDRMGGIIFNGIDGETVSYNGTDYTYKGIADLSVKYDKAANVTTYGATIRDDIKFSDGVKMTADDIIFNYYAYLDPSYVGSSTLSSVDIIGLKAYQTQTPTEIYDKYDAIAADIYAAGYGYTCSGDESFTQEQYDLFWTEIEKAWATHTGVIANYVWNNFATDAETVGAYFGAYADKVAAGDEDYKIALGMCLWGYGELDEAGALVAPSGAKFDIANGEFPTTDDYAVEVMAAYDNDPVAYYETETTGEGEADVLSTATSAFITEAASEEPEAAGGVPNIEGIKKTGEYSVEIKVNGYDAAAVYQVLGIQIAPMHYYGSEDLYDYDNNKFGFEFGNFTLNTEKQTVPVGAGPYKFVEYKNKIVYFEANEDYYKGAPKTKEVQFKEVNMDEVAAGVQAGTLDAGEMDGSITRFDEVKGYNSNGELVGDAITTNKVDFLGYGYIGINSELVNVGGVSNSNESKNLRKGIATVLSVFRDTTIESYYGEAASVIQYPISNTSWAAPQATDAGYKLAYSQDVDGKDIYTSDMTQDQKEESALKAAIGYLKAAGYTFDDASGKFTSAPEGASLSYEIVIPADGSGNHPSFALLTEAKAALETIGITLNINDPANSNELWTGLDSCTIEMWCAAWGATIDPDMYQVYYSTNVVGVEGSSESNHYHIIDATLDKLIMDARTSDDQSYRKTVYKQCLDIVMDWAVEIPVYQRQNCTLISTKRVNVDTVTKDITSFYSWMKEIENIEMN